MHEQPRCGQFCIFNGPSQWSTGQTDSHEQLHGTETNHVLVPGCWGRCLSGEHRREVMDWWWKQGRYEQGAFSHAGLAEHCISRHNIEAKEFRDLGLHLSGATDVLAQGTAILFLVCFLDVLL